MKGSSPWKTPKRCAKTPSETPFPAHSSSEERENAAAWQKLFHELPFASPTVSTLGATPQEKAESVAQNEWLHAAPKQSKRYALSTNCIEHVQSTRMPHRQGLKMMLPY